MFDYCACVLRMTQRYKNAELKLKEAQLLNKPISRHFFHGQNPVITTGIHAILCEGRRFHHADFAHVQICCVNSP